jgi:hypothetical protein
MLGSVPVLPARIGLQILCVTNLSHRDLKLPSQRIDSEPHRVQRMARWGCGADAVGEALGRKRCIDKANGLGELLTREAHSRTDSA